MRYESGGETVDEEFFGLMTPKLTIPYHGPQGTTYEYHRTLALVHSIGAKGDTKGDKLESMRPLLGYMARSYEVDKVWEKQRDVVIKQLNDAYNRNLAAGYAQIEAAGRLSRSISANNDAMIQAMDESRAEQRAANATRVLRVRRTREPRISTSTFGVPKRWRIRPATSRNNPACTAITGRTGSETTCIRTTRVSTPTITPTCPMRG